MSKSSIASGRGSPSGPPPEDSLEARIDASGVTTAENDAAPGAEDADVVRVKAEGGMYIASKSKDTLILQTTRKVGEKEVTTDKIIGSWLRVNSRLLPAEGKGRWAEVEFFDDTTPAPGGKRKTIIRRVSLAPGAMTEDIESLALEGYRFSSEVGTRDSRGARVASYVQAAVNDPGMKQKIYVQRDGWLQRDSETREPDWCRYAMAGKVITAEGLPVREYCYIPDPPEDRKVRLPVVSRIRGTLAEWRREAVPIMAHSSLMALGVGVALSGCIVELLGENLNPIVYIFGERGTGKSLVLRLAATVWGGDVLSSFNARVGNEIMISRYDSKCAIMDEISAGLHSSILDIIYAVGNGVGRGAATSGGKLLPIRHYDLSMLMAGEPSVSDLSKLVRGRGTTGGEESRIIGFRVEPNGEFGVFDNPPPGATPTELFSRLGDFLGKPGQEKVCGVLGAEFAQHFVNEIHAKGFEAIRREYAKFVDDFRRDFLGADNQVDPAILREQRLFARIAYAVFKAQQYELLPLQNEDGNDLNMVAIIAAACQHCATRESTVEARIEQVIADMVGMRDNGPAFFIDTPFTRIERPYAGSVKCKAIICERTVEADPGDTKVRDDGRPVAVAFTLQQMDALALAANVDKLQLRKAIVKRGIVRLSGKKQDPRYRGTRSGAFGLLRGSRAEPTGQYFVLSVDAYAADNEDERVAALVRLGKILAGDTSA